MTKARRANSPHSNHLRSLTQKQKWADRKAQLRDAEQAAMKKVRAEAEADYARREKAGLLTPEELKRRHRNKQRKASRDKWDGFCSTISTGLILGEINVLMRKGTPKKKPTLEHLVKLAEREFGFKITQQRMEQLTRILKRSL